jgi:hypothetical protein
MESIVSTCTGRVNIYLPDQIYEAYFFFPMLENSKTVNTRPIISIKKINIAGYNKKSALIFDAPSMHTI